MSYMPDVDGGALICNLNGRLDGGLPGLDRMAGFCRKGKTISLDFCQPKSERDICPSTGLRKSTGTHRHLSRFLTAVALVSLNANQKSKSQSLLTEAVDGEEQGAGQVKDGSHRVQTRAFQLTSCLTK